MPYSVVLRPTAVEFLSELPGKHQRQIRDKVDSLAEDPRPPGAETLQGHPEFWKIRSGHYRIIYTIQEDILVVTVVKIGHRKDVYRRLKQL